jgi:parvulin-like peptidyl-prolyl isomerase
MRFRFGLELGRQSMRACRFIPLALIVAATASAAGPVLRVNDTELTATDLKLARQLVALQVQRQKTGTDASEETMLRRSVDRLIDQTLLLQAAREAKVEVSPAEVAADVDQQRVRRGAAAFDAYLADLGLTVQEFSRKVEDQMAVRKFADAVVARGVTVTEMEAKTFFDANPAMFEQPEEVRVRTILFLLDPQAAPARERAELVRTRVLKGEDMAALAKKVSDDPSGPNGGDIGWVRKGMLLPELEPVVWALKSGELSEVLKSALGYHIFKVEDRRVARKVPFDEVKSKLTDIIRNKKLVAALEALVKERRSRARVEALDPGVKAVL